MVCTNAEYCFQSGVQSPYPLGHMRHYKIFPAPNNTDHQIQPPSTCYWNPSLCRKLLMGRVNFAPSLLWEKTNIAHKAKVTGNGIFWLESLYPTNLKTTTFTTTNRDQPKLHTLTKSMLLTIQALTR
eukprot:m.6250 g.6250  ORF g.6250 m.6250 type:complete len:127 (-) comp3507_c0_seq1:49-429(-)